MTALEFAQHAYDLLRRSELRRRSRKGKGRVPTWDDLPASERSRRVAIAERCMKQYARAPVKESRLTGAIATP